MSGSWRPTLTIPLARMPRIPGHQKLSARPLAAAQRLLPPSGRLRVYLTRLAAEGCACESCERLLEVLR